MANRVIIHQNVEGSTSLPSRFVFYGNASSIYGVDDNLYDSSDTSVDRPTSQGKLVYAVLGDSDQEYSYTFPAQYTDDELPTHIKALKAKFQNQVLVDLNRSFFNDFYIITTDDYSSQAMTTKNYDCDVKVFGTNGAKIQDRYIAIVKSYTDKKMWILIDKNVGLYSVTNPFVVVIDPTYKFSKILEAEADSKTKYKYSSESNLLDMYKRTNSTSPYFDKMYATLSNSDINHLLNKESKYFTFSLADLLNLNPSTTTSITFPPTYPHPETYEISPHTKTAREFNFNTNPKLLTSLSSDTTNANYTNLYMSDVYGYLSTTRTAGVRITSISDVINGTYSTFEVYPRLSSTIKYTFSCNETFFNLDATSRLKSVRKFMKDNHIYGYNYKDLVVFSGKSDSGYYVDACFQYIEQIPLGDKITVEDVDTSTYGLAVIATINSQADLSNFDPIKISSSVIDNSEICHPYYGDDPLIPVLDTDTVKYPILYSVNATNSSKQACRIRDLQECTSETNKFDIVAGSRSDVDSGEIKHLADYGLSSTWRTDLINTTEYDDVISKYDANYKALCENLELQIPIASTRSDLNTINMQECFFIEFTSSNKIEMIEYTYIDNNKNITFKKSILPYKQDDQSAYHYIVPSENGTTNLSTIKFTGNRSTVIVR